VPCDACGDPLPPGARLRLGTTRFRADPYRGLVLSADRKLMACGTSSYVVRVCSTETGKELGRVKAGRWLAPGAFSPDGRLLATVGDGRVLVFDWRTGHLLLDVSGGGRLDHGWFDVVASFAHEGKELATWDSRGQLVVRDAETGGVLRAVRFVAYGECCASFSPDGSRLAVRTGRQTLRVQQTDGKGFLVFPLPWYGARCHFAWSPDGNRLGVGGRGRSEMLLIDLRRGQARLWAVRDDHEVVEPRLAISPDGKQLVVEDDDNLLLCDVARARVVRKLPRKDDLRLCALAFLEAGRILSLDRRGVIHLQDARTGKELPRPAGPDDQATGLAFREDGRLLTSSGGEGVVHVWDLTTGRSKGQIAADTHTGAVAVSGESAAHCTGGRGDLSFLNLSTMKRLWTAKVPVSMGCNLDAWSRECRPPQSRLALSRDGKWLAVRVDPSSPPYLDVYETTAKKKLRSVEEQDRGAIAFTPDGLLVMAGGDAVRLVDPRTGQTHRLASWTGTFDVRQVVLSGDGRLMAVLGDRLVYVLERLTGDVIAKMAIPEQFGWKSAAFTVDGRLLLAGPSSVLDLGSGACLCEEESSCAVALSPDARTLALAQDDTSILIYDVPQPKQRKSPRPNDRRLASLWDDLGGSARRALEGTAILADHPDLTLPLLRVRLKPTTTKVSRRLVDGLDAEDFAVRQAASTELSALLEKGEPGCLEMLREAAMNYPSLEGRLRARRLVAPYASKAWTPTGEALRGARAVAVLERIGDAEAVALLKKLAAGAPGFQTAEAKAALERLGR
jgi:WD40 repeat protein